MPTYPDDIPLYITCPRKYIHKDTHTYIHTYWYITSSLLLEDGVYGRDLIVEVYARQPATATRGQVAHMLRH